MRDKYANKSPVMRIFHKYTGIIFVGIVIAIAVPIIMDYQSKQAFFETWSCDMINYYLDNDETSDHTTHEKLSEKDHIRLHEIIQSCGLTHK